MNCHEVQTALGADPHSRDAALGAHIEHCAKCHAYRDELRDMDRLIQRALDVPVDATQLDLAAPGARAQRNSTFNYWRIAASLVASLAIAGTVLIASTHESLAEQVAAHAKHEVSMREITDRRADSQRITHVLKRDGLALRSDTLAVSHAASCAFRGREVPHLVVQTERGPVTVMVLSHEKPVSSAQPFNEGGFQGVIVPAPRGVLAVLGENVPIEPTLDQVLAALEYR